MSLSKMLDILHANARSPRDLQWSGALPVQQFVALLQANVRIVHLAYTNDTVHSVLIRKNQGPESGASQPHLHNQVIASHALFPDIEVEMQVTAQEPHIWAECVEFFRHEGWVIHEAWCPGHLLESIWQVPALLRCHRPGPLGAADGDAG